MFSFDNNKSLSQSRFLSIWGSHFSFLRKQHPLQTTKNQKVVLITGGAGFIGSHTAEALLNRSDSVVIIDNLNDHYDPKIKVENLLRLQKTYTSHKIHVYINDINDSQILQEIFATEPCNYIVHLAGRAGVRISINQPFQFIRDNINGTASLLELARLMGSKLIHFIYASSSSVYGDYKTLTPLDETLNCNSQCSVYAVTKRTVELLSNCYNQLYKFPITGLRFFSVYGPRCRTDMAPYLFIDKIFRDEVITVYGDGNSNRDFTYIDDIVNGILLCLDKTNQKTGEESKSGSHEILNLGCCSPIKINDFIKIVERHLNRKARINYSNKQLGDIQHNYACTEKANSLLGYKPNTLLNEGLKLTVDWYIQTHSRSKTETTAAQIDNGTPSNSSSTMNAVVAYGPLKYKYETCYPIPLMIAEDDILVEVVTVGICSSDCKMYNGAELYWNSLTGRAKPPVIPGHEFVGKVAKINPSTAERYKLMLGDLIVCEQLYVCNRCWYCLHGRENKCDNLKIYGQAINGAMANYMIYKHGSFIHKVPTELSPYQAVLAEPLAVSIYAYHKADINFLKSDEIIYVAGSGIIGLGIIATCRAYAHKSTIIIASDYSDFKLIQAKREGADHVINLKQHDSSTADFIKELCKERGGVDVYFEASGHSESIEYGINILRKQGKFIHVGICTHSHISIDWNSISAHKELTIIGSSLGRRCWPEAFQLLCQGVLTNTVTQVYTLEEYQDAFLSALNPVNSIKVIIDPRVAESKPLIEGFKLYKSANIISTDTKLISSRQYQLKSAIALVTGSSRGIGRCIAQELSKQGAFVIFHGSRLNSCQAFNESKGLNLEELALETSHKTGNPTYSVIGDLANLDNVKRISHEIRHKFNRIDLIVCVAGGNIGNSGVNTITGGKPLNDDCFNISLSDYHSIFNRNLLSTFLILKELTPLMKSQNSGRIITIGSKSVLEGQVHGVVHSLAKASVHQYTQCLANQLKPFNIRVNCLAPGPTLTERYKRNINFDEFHTIPKGEQVNLFHSVSEVSRIACAMANEKLCDFTGQIICTDKGKQLFGDYLEIQIKLPAVN